MRCWEHGTQTSLMKLVSSNGSVGVVYRYRRQGGQWLCLIESPEWPDSLCLGKATNSTEEFIMSLSFRQQQIFQTQCRFRRPES